MCRSRTRHDLGTIFYNKIAMNNRELIFVGKCIHIAQYRTIPKHKTGFTTIDHIYQPCCSSQLRKTFHRQRSRNFLYSIGQFQNL